MSGTRVAIVTLGCARNDVDSDELAARVATAGYQLVDDAQDADAVLVNTCGFIESAKKDSIDAILGVADDYRAVLAVGCMAERYGNELAVELPEAAGVLGFDEYTNIAEHIQTALAGETIASHQPRDRRKLLPISPVDRQQGGAEVPGHGVRVRIGDGPVESVKIASGCDRRCSFCAIPSFRGSFLSRRPTDILNESRDLVAQGVREINLVSENSTSYGKDLGDLRLLESLLPELGSLHNDVRIRVAYLQPAELRPELIATIAHTDGVAPYFDLSFQHASPAVLRRMRRFGGTADFLELISRIRAIAPEAGIRTNVIVGFPGETDAEYQELRDFLTQSRLDAVGVFAYSDEDGTEAVALSDHVDPEVVAMRLSDLTDWVEELADQRAAERIGDVVDVLIESIDGPAAVGRAAHQGPEDGDVTVNLRSQWRIGERIRATVVRATGIDLVAEEE